MTLLQRSLNTLVIDMPSVAWNSSDTALCHEMVSRWIALQPVESNPDGLNAIWRDITERFFSLGFHVEIIENPDAVYRPILVATRVDNNESPWLGFFGHYDVEPADPSAWGTNPWVLHENDGRWTGRGVADNLVPLAQRLVLFNRFPHGVNLVYVLQGEEEIGSPFANVEYPNLSLPTVRLWIEETGYFYNDGRQRLMYLNPNPLLERIFGSLEAVLDEHQQDMVKRNRPLNKAFGSESCPCLTHLVQDTPYLAIGPNDDSSKVHGVDESITLSHLDLVSKQYLRIAEVIGSG